MLTIGVIADTHIPDRTKTLHPDVLPTFQQAGVNHILHAGDISVPKILKQLEKIAPVSAVRGNRDWFGFDNLPLTRLLTFESITLGLTHGHGGLRRYMMDKFEYIFKGPQNFTFFMHRAIAMLPNALDVVVFGHNHAPMNNRLEGKLIFNPGSANRQFPRDLPPSLGFLHIDGDKVDGEIVYLSHLRL
ncbi:MAG: YfcE family phosphodiesterase [Chloroflexi bacterium]|nr:YfcE family phosphodiesterase [Chloroflexota bacterium]